MSNDLLRELQLKELNILLEVDRICKENNIAYYLIGGTALGAIRHKGFIPWDDDIDIGLPRKDYNRFIACCKSQLGKDFFLQTLETDRNYMYEFAKIRLNKTAFVQDELKNFRIHHGIFIDIFPLDGIPDNKVIRSVQKNVFLMFRTIRGWKVNSSAKNPLNGLVKKVVGAIFPWGVVHYAINKVSSSVDTSKVSKMSNILGNVGYEREIVPVEYFGSPINQEFEGHLFPVPHELDKYLNHLYGNYMQLPPVEKRKNHNPYYIDLNKEYVVK